MTLHGEYEIGVRELHDRLSEHLDRVAQGSEIVVTRRGTPIARLSAVNHEDPLAALVKRGLVTAPKRPRAAKHPCVRSTEPVSDLVDDQRR